MVAFSRRTAAADCGGGDPEMISQLTSRTDESGSLNLRDRIAAIFLLLIAVNIAGWAWAFVAFHHFPLLLGTALLAYSFGLRHAVDADHIAAIDNVTRKLMQEGKRPVAVGLYFSLGHSTIVIAASAAVAVTAIAFKEQLEPLRSIGNIVGTSISSLFLLLIAMMNFITLRNAYKTFRRVKSGGTYEEAELDGMLAGSGLLARIFRPMFRMITKSWHMYPLGFLFGLGFDTATEVGLLGISAAAAGNGVHIWSIMVFPILFTAGMSLVDTADGVLMLGAYGWAFIRPVRKLYYNMTITFVSVVVAVAVGGIEAFGLIGSELNRTGWFWGMIERLNDNFGMLGFGIIGLFVVSWLIAALIYRLKRYDQLDLARESPGE
jgi:high-affinity nickel-transport protein